MSPLADTWEDDRGPVLVAFAQELGAGVAVVVGGCELVVVAEVVVVRVAVVVVVVTGRVVVVGDEEDVVEEVGVVVPVEHGQTVTGTTVVAVGKLMFE